MHIKITGPADVNKVLISHCLASVWLILTVVGGFFFQLLVFKRFFLSVYCVNLLLFGAD